MKTDKCWRCGEPILEDNEVFSDYAKTNVKYKVGEKTSKTIQVLYHEECWNEEMRETAEDERDKLNYWIG